MDLRWWYLGDSTLVSAIPDAISTFSFPYFSVICSTSRAGMKACSWTCLDPSILFVSVDSIESIYMIPGWTHNIINLSETEDLVTVMTCNEVFDPNHPDTFFEKVTLN